MVGHVLRLECLPNELIIEICRYLDTRALLRALYHLNTRVDSLIHSLTHLTYATSEKETNVCAILHPYLSSLTLDSELREKLPHFPQLRRLTLNYVTDDFMAQFNDDIFPDLEHISIHRQVHPFHMSDLRQKIFSNTFPRLQSCYLSRMRLVPSIEQWRPLLALRWLKLNDIDSLIYTSILSACPNLSFLKFKLLIDSKVQSSTVRHTNLKQLVINNFYNDWPWDESVLEGYLLCVPSLEQFSLHRSISIESVTVSFPKNYDWLSTILSSHLPSIDRLIFYLSIFPLIEMTKSATQEIFQGLHDSFSSVHSSRSRHQLIVSGE